MKHTILILGILTFICSCEKAGTGGRAHLMVYPEHHGVPVKNHVGWPDTVFLKFNVDEMPGTKPSDYDVFFIGNPGEDHVDCDGLRVGKYYVFVTGFDSTGPYRVSGGRPLTIRSSEKNEHKTFVVPVSE